MSDATPTVMEWRIDQFNGEWGAIGFERPASRAHDDRRAGKMILDGDTWREARYVYVPLPSDPNGYAMSLLLLKAAG